MNKNIEELENEINKLKPDLEQKKLIYDKASTEFYLIKGKIDDLHREIELIKKQELAETFKKSVGKGELLSLRQFFKEIKDNRDFTGKTVVWSSKRGKSGTFLNLSITDSEASKTLLERHQRGHIKDPKYFIIMVRDFKEYGFDDFGFECSTYGSMVSGNSYYDKNIDDLYVFICDTKLLSDFRDISETEGLLFFENLPYVYESNGKMYKNEHKNIEYLSLGSCGVQKNQFGDYKLYPLKANEGAGAYQ